MIECCPQVPEGKVVVLSFRFIDLESDNLCRYDYVDVYSGHVSGQRLGRFCGTFRPGALVSTGNKMLIQMVSDANTAGRDQYCGGRLDKPSGSFKTPNWPEKDYPAGVTCSWHIVAPKNQKFPTTTVPPTTTIPAATTRPIPLKYSVALCQQKCKRSGTVESNYCTSDFVITGTVITAVVRGGSMYATISIINVYKEGNLAIQQAGKTMSTKIIILCKKCPFIRRGLNYIFMGSADEDGKGKIAPHHFVMAFKAKNQRALNVLKTKRC
ncbi:unnamed protein product [Coregonus sp. 'balchen']|nr:unnamed protein product [Coregonus sp. 'balchen']